MSLPLLLLLLMMMKMTYRLCRRIQDIGPPLAAWVPSSGRTARADPGRTDQRRFCSRRKSDGAGRRFEGWLACVELLLITHHQAFFLVASRLCCVWH